MVPIPPRITSPCPGLSADCVDTNAVVCGGYDFSPASTPVVTGVELLTSGELFITGILLEAPALVTLGPYSCPVTVHTDTTFLTCTLPGACHVEGGVFAGCLYL
jgi:hypothetical protein